MAETIASLAVRIGADIGDFDKKMKEFKRSFGKVGQQVQSVGQTIGTAFTATGGAIAVGLGMAVNKAMDFDAQMSRVGAIAGATGNDLEALRQTALDLGASTSKSATEVAQGMELMAAMGFNTNQVISAMPGVISAAEASGEDMALVAETVAAALNAFGLEASEASRVSDVLAQAANDSAAGVQDMQYAFKYAAPLAKQLGISMEELAAATEIMTNAGMKGEQAGTSLRMAFIRLSDPPKEAATQLENLGVQVTDTQGNMLPFSNIVGQLKTGLEGMGNAQKTAALAQIFGAEAASGMLNIIDAGPEKLNALTTALQNSTGASKETAIQMKDNLKGALEELGGAAETAQISIGSSLAPAIRTVAGGLQGIINIFNQLSPETQKFISIGAAVTAMLLLLTGVIAFAVAGLGALAAAEWAVILPIAGIIAGIVAAIAVITALAIIIYSKWGEITQFLSETWGTIQSSAVAVWNAIAAFFKEWWGTILIGIFTGGLGIIIPLVIKNWDKISAFTSETWQKIKESISNAFTSAVQWVKTKISELPTIMANAWNDILNFLSSLPSKLYNAGSSIMKGLKDGMGSIRLPIPKITIEWAEGPMGIKIPKVNIGVNWKSLRDLVPFLADGGITTGPTLAMIGEGSEQEAVLPLSKLESLVGTGNGTGTIIIELDSKTIAKKTFEHMGGVLRVRGVTP